jgi:hypothetical protein
LSGVCEDESDAGDDGKDVLVIDSGCNRGEVWPMPLSRTKDDKNDTRGIGVDSGIEPDEPNTESESAPFRLKPEPRAVVKLTEDIEVEGERP